MTKEIAIGIIKELQSKPLENRELTALDMAIQALSQEPCDDAISREMALKEKIERLRELSKEIKKYEDIVPLYQGDYIDLAMLKDEVFEIIGTL